MGGSLRRPGRDGLSELADDRRRGPGHERGHRRPGELLAVAAAGAIHVILELIASEAAALTWSGIAAIGFGAYLLRRALRDPGLFVRWGFRTDGLPAALRAHLSFAAVGGGGLFAWATLVGRPDIPPGFWLTLLLYPVWGLTQQFALQNLIVRNLETWVNHPLALAAAGAALFSASHAPRLDLVFLTLIGGIPFVLLYRRHPNLWAVGLAHGVLGTMAAYLVLREDPGGAILAWLS